MISEIEQLHVFTPVRATSSNPENANQQVNASCSTSCDQHPEQHDPPDPVQSPLTVDYNIAEYVTDPDELVLVKKESQSVSRIDELKRRGQICDQIIAGQLGQLTRLAEHDTVPPTFVRWPNICVGSQQQRFAFEQSPADHPNSILVYRQGSWPESLLGRLLNYGAVCLYGSVGTGMSHIMYEFACRMRAQRAEYRVLYVNNATKSKFIFDAVESLISVLYESWDVKALACLKRAYEKSDETEEEETLTDDPELAKKCIHACIKSLISRGIKIVSIVDQCNNLNTPKDLNEVLWFC